MFFNQENGQEICDKIFFTEFCKNNLNCYYKQRKRAEYKLDKIKEYCNNCNLKADFTACDVLQIIEGKENE